MDIENLEKIKEEFNPCPYENMGGEDGEIIGSFMKCVLGVLKCQHIQIERLTKRVKKLEAKKEAIKWMILKKQ